MFPETTRDVVMIPDRDHLLRRYRPLNCSRLMMIMKVSSSAGPPECQWSPPSGATTCRIVATDSLANVRDIRSGVKDATNCNEGSARSCLLTQKLTGSNISSHRLSSGLIPEGQNIYWFVRCGAEGVDGEWSPARRFRLRSSDPDPVEVMVSNVSPSSGSYRMGGALTVTWDANAAMTDEMLISLKRDAYSGSALGGDYVVLVTGTANDGAQTFIIPTNLNAASDWRIYVKHVMSERWAAASGTVSVMSPSEPASGPSGNGDYCGDENGNNSGLLYTCTNGTYSLKQQCSHGCDVGAPGQNDTCSPAPMTCNATQDWSPNTMSASSLGRSHSQSIDVELEINFRGTGSAGQVEFQVGKF